MYSTAIKRIPILPMGMVNAFLIRGRCGAVLVDTGLPGSEKKIETILHKHHLTFSDIKLIIITHAHVDHAGAAAKVRELSGAPIVAHEGDQQYYNCEKVMTFCPTGWFGHVFLRTGLMLEPYTPFRPDIMLSERQTLALDAYGVDGIVTCTPGHTAGSLSVILSSGEALVGDLISSGILLGGIMLTGIPKRPPFEDNPHKVAQELEHCLTAGAKKFYVGHGGPLATMAVHKHIDKLRKMPVCVDCH